MNELSKHIQNIKNSETLNEKNVYDIEETKSFFTKIWNLHFSFFYLLYCLLILILSYCLVLILKIFNIIITFLEKFVI